MALITSASKPKRAGGCKAGWDSLAFVSWRPLKKHWEPFQKTLLVGKAVGNLMTDAQLAALAVEHDGVLYSTDNDFARFPGLKWSNPIARQDSTSQRRHGGGAGDG